MKWFWCLFLLLFGIHVLAEDKTVINFAPLPMKKSNKNIQDFVPLTSYLHKNMGLNIKYINKDNYEDILQSFQDGDIDIAYLGPLPLVSLKQRYPFIEPIILFKQKNGSEKYRCVLTKFSQDNIDLNTPLKVALTQPLSTCGYFMAQKLLHEVYGVELKDQLFDYLMSHDDAVMGALDGNYILAGAKESIATRYNSVGMDIVAQSELLPGFSLVANTKTLSQKQIKDIQKMLLGIPSPLYKKWKGIFANGFIKADIKAYEVIDIDFTTIPKQGNSK